MIKYLDCDIGFFRPRFKLGKDPLTAPILGGVGLVSSLIGFEESEVARETNIEENEKNRRFNREEAEKNRTWQTAEREASQGYQSAEWDRRNEIEYQTWLRQNEYNSPVNQVKRLAAAGFNPSAMTGGSAEGLIDSSSLQPSVSSPPVPSGSQASVSTPNPVNAVQGTQAFSSVVSSIGSLISDTAKAGRDSAEARQLNATLSSIVNEYAERIKNLGLQNELAEIEKYRQSSTLPASIGKAFGELDKLQADIFLARMSGKKVEAEYYTEQVRKAVLEQDWDLKDQDIQKGLVFLSRYEKMLDSQINEIVSRSAANYGSAAAGYASAEESRASARLRTLEADIQDYTNHIQMGNIDWESETMRTQYADMMRSLAKNLNASNKEIEQIDRYLETMNLMRNRNGFLRALDNLATYMNVKFGVNIVSVPSALSSGRSVVKGFR